jgi:RNA polymerase sigma-70 factor (ECF subfamily)
MREYRRHRRRLDGDLMRAAADGNDLSSLATRASRGDREAFAALVQATHGTCYRLALRLLGGDRGEAEDAVQDTYVSAWRALPRLRDPGAVLGWLCRITRNIATDRVRRLQRRRTDSLDREVGEGMGALVDYLADPAAGPEAQTASAEVQAGLREVLDQLKEKHRVILLLREVDGMSYEELAAALGCPVGTVESRLHRARLALAGKLERLLRKQAKEAA